MARDLGPVWLEELEARRPTMSQAEYDSERIRIEEQIRRGKAVELSTADRRKQALIMLAGFLVALFAYERGGHPLFLALALGVSFWFAFRVGRA